MYIHWTDVPRAYKAVDVAKCPAPYRHTLCLINDMTILVFTQASRLPLPQREPSLFQFQDNPLKLLLPSALNTTLVPFPLTFPNFYFCLILIFHICFLAGK